jgi:hypothetical protein
MDAAWSDATHCAEIEAAHTSDGECGDGVDLVFPATDRFASAYALRKGAVEKIAPIRHAALPMVAILGRWLSTKKQRYAAAAFCKKMTMEGHQVYYSIRESA